MSFSQDRFLGSTSGGDIEELINSLSEKTFYRDGSKSMQGPIGMIGNNIIGPSVVEMNELAVGITPASGKVSIYALTDKKLYIKDDTGTETELGVGGGGGDVVGPISSTNNALARFDGTTGKILQNSVATLGDAGVLRGLTGLEVDGASVIELTTDAANATALILNTSNAIGGIEIQYDGVDRIKIDSTGLSFFNNAPVAKPTITGTRSGNNALQDLLTDLDSLGLITDNTTAGSGGGGGDLSSNTSSSTLNRLALFADTSGKLIKESDVVIDNAGAISGLTELDIDNLKLNGNNISSTNTDGDVIIDTDGNGFIYLNGYSSLFRSNGVGFGLSIVVDNSVASIQNLNTNQNLQLEANGTGKVIIRNSELKVEELYQLTPSGATETVIVNSSGDLGSIPRPAVLQLRRTSSYSVPTSYTIMGFGVTDIQSNLDIISTNSTVAICHAVGFYELTFQAILELPDDQNRVYSFKFQVDSIDVNGGEIIMDLYQANNTDKENQILINHSVIVELDPPNAPVTGSSYCQCYHDMSSGGGITEEANKTFIVKYLGP